MRRDKIQLYPYQNLIDNLNLLRHNRMSGFLIERLRGVGVLLSAR